MMCERRWIGVCVVTGAAYALAVIAVWLVGWSVPVTAAVGGGAGLLGLWGSQYWLLGPCLREMNERRQHADHELQQLNESRQHFERLLAEREAELTYLHQQLQEAVAKHNHAEAQLQQQRTELVDISRKAGLADMATSVLHNVGNVLNSVNVTATLLKDRLEHSRLSSLGKAAHLIKDHEAQLPQFLGEDPQGKQLPAFLDKLSETLIAERDGLIQESNSLIGHINHVKEIIAVQQSAARVVGAVEPFDLADAIEDALKINLAGLQRHHVTVRRDYEKGLIVKSDRHKLIQILVNLISNAKYAIQETGRGDGELAVSVQRTPDDQVALSVKDNGVGICAEDQAKLFRRGFTTRASGHGFGLHVSALAAQELYGGITVHSEGRGHGATFMIRFPMTSPEKNPCQCVQK